jgi:hypothetical protein
MTVAICAAQYRSKTSYFRYIKKLLRGRLHGAFFTSDKPFVASDKPFVAEACPPMLHATASNGLSYMKDANQNAPCNRPLMGQLV